MFSPFKQEIVRQAHIMVVGCGALGNEVLKNLAMMGVGHLTLVDFDHVEADNLSRSVLFSEENALSKRLKVEAAAQRLKQMRPDIEIRTICGDIAYDVGLGILRRMDAVVGCVDSRWARYCINRLCMRAGVPWVDGAIDGLEGTARVFIPGRNCYACNLGPQGLKEMALRMPCSGTVRRDMAAGKAPTTSVMASIIGAVQVQEVLKLIPATESPNTLRSLCGKMFYYEGGQLTTKLVDFVGYDDDCPVHDRWEPIVQSPLTRESTVEETLDWLKSPFLLGDDCFVDYIADTDKGSKTEMMCPGRKVACLIDEDKTLRGIPFSRFNQHEWKEIDSSFPYKHLTLGALGIPEEAVLKAKKNNEEYYFELKSEN